MAIKFDSWKCNTIKMIIIVVVIIFNANAVFIVNKVNNRSHMKATKDT